MSDPFSEQPGTTDTSSDFFDGGSPSCRFNNIGDVHQGEIVNFEESQQRDIKTKALTSWPDGNPKMMLVVTLQTSERDDQIEDDDGERRLYVNKPSGMFAAIRTAIGKEKFAKGGKLAVKYTGNGKPTNPMFNAPKEYVAKYTPPGAIVPAQRAASNGHWSWEEAQGKAAEVGITTASLTERLKTMGCKGYKPERDTSVVKEIIAEAKANSPFGETAEFDEASIPF